MRSTLISWRAVATPAGRSPADPGPGGLFDCIGGLRPYVCERSLDEGDPGECGRRSLKRAVHRKRLPVSGALGSGGKCVSRRVPAGTDTHEPRLWGASARAARSLPAAGEAPRLARLRSWRGLALARPGNVLASGGRSARAGLGRRAAGLSAGPRGADLHRHEIDRARHRSGGTRRVRSDQSRGPLCRGASGCAPGLPRQFPSARRAAADHPARGDQRIA